MGSIETPPPGLSERHDLPPDFPYRLPKDLYARGLAQLPEAVNDALPTGFPAQVHGPATWSGADLKDRDEEWVTQLLTEESQAIKLAVESFLASKRPLQDISAETFPLPASLSSKLDNISEGCYHGLGFSILRGLEDQDQSEEGRAVLFAGISAHVASSRGFQDIDRQNVLAHLFKRHPKEANEYIPPSFNNAELSFHSDAGDMVALYYASFHSQGGQTRLASGSKVYNEIAASRPDILAVLAEHNWSIYQWDLDVPSRFIPLLHHHGDDGITFQFTRLPFSRYDNSRVQRPDVPAVTATQIEALNALQIMHSKHDFAVPHQAGDILYFNNLKLAHAREPYTETTDAASLPETKDRHILRLWLRDPKRAIPLDPALQVVWDSIYGPNTDHGREEIWNTKPIAAFAMNRENNG